MGEGWVKGPVNAGRVLGQCFGQEGRRANRSSATDPRRFSLARVQRPPKEIKNSRSVESRKIYHKLLQRPQPEIVDGLREWAAKQGRNIPGLVKKMDETRSISLEDALTVREYALEIDPATATHVRRSPLLYVMNFGVQPRVRGRMPVIKRAAGYTNRSAWCSSLTTSFNPVERQLFRNCQNNVYFQAKELQTHA